MQLRYTAQSNLNSFTSNSHTLSVTIPSGFTNTALLIFKDCNNDLPWTTFNDVTVNGSTAGVVAVVDSGAGLANRSIRVWRVVNPTPGTYNIAANFSTSSANGGLLLVAMYDDVDQTTPIADFEAGSGGSVPSPIGIAPLTTPSGGYGVFAARAFGGSSLAPSGLATLVGSASGESAVAQLLNGTSTNFSWTGTSPTQVSAVAVALNPAAGAAPVAFTGTVPTQNATVGVSFSVDLASYFSGALTPFTWSTFAGTLPAGLTRTDSVISGVPTVAGTSTGIQIRATDTGSNVATTNAFSIVVAAAPAVPFLALSDLKNWSGTLQASVTIPKVLVLNPTTGGTVLNLSSVTTTAGADMTIADASLVSGTWYLVLGWNTDRSAAFRVFVQAQT
jgi:hypothetical protein